MKKIIPLFALSLFLFAACNPKASSSTLSDESLFGTWVRQATYVNDELEHETPATLTIAADRFASSNEMCSTSGSAELNEDDQLEVTMTESDCPAPLSLPFTIIYDYVIDQEGHLNMSVQGVTEVYERQ